MKNLDNRFLTAFLILSFMLFLSSCVQNFENEKNMTIAGHIVNGQEVKNRDSFRSVVRITGANGFTCTASKVGHYTYLTAAHCIIGETNNKLVYGYNVGEKLKIKTHLINQDKDLQVYIERIYISNSYKKYMMNFNNEQYGDYYYQGTIAQVTTALDIALIVVDRPTNPIEIANISYDQLDQEHISVKAAGYGVTTRNYYEMNVTDIDYIRSKQFIVNGIPAPKYIDNFIDDKISLDDLFKMSFATMFINEDIEKLGSVSWGDSGAALFYRGEIIGVVAQLIPLVVELEEDNSKFVHVTSFSRISSLEYWIESKIK